MTRLPAVLVAIVCLASAVLSPPPARGQDQSPPADRFVLNPGESVVVVGNSFAERVAMSGYLEALIHAAHPDHEITVRQVPWSADEAGFQPRELNVPTTEAYLTQQRADVIIACFGMSESFAGNAGMDQFEQDLRTQLGVWTDARYNGRSRPRIVLVSPIRHEDLGAPWPTGATVQQHNATLRGYVDVMRRAARDIDARFVDLLPAPAAPPPGPLTTDGILPSELGCWYYTREFGRQLGWLDEAASTDPPATSPLVREFRLRAWDKHYHFRQVYRPTNTEYVWGRRAEPFGVVNFPPEHEQLRRMVDARQRDLWQIEKPSPAALFTSPPSGQPIWETIPASNTFPEDTWSPPPVVAEGTETSLGSTDIVPPDEFLNAFSVADGYTIECFASEQDFPQLANPLAMAFDERHRLWVLCSPTYPHPLPGETVKDQLIILSDEDNDGKADRCDLFAEGFGIATGFAIVGENAYVAIAPDLLYFQDTDGDGKADRREVILSGFGMPDSHHQISALEWAPDGGFLMHEGTFTRAGIETPFGTRRGRDASIWHYDPASRRLECLSHCGFPNPWGHAFDDYGASLMDSTSGGAHYAMSHISTAFAFPHKPGKPGPVVNRGRPTAGNEILNSRHFPSEAQGSHLTTQSIGFHGLRWDRLDPAGSSWLATPMPQDLLQSSDTNFRPVAVETGPDGALYVLDWCNPIIGHMQYSVRDPRRDHSHGRVWRVRHASRPLLTPPDIAGASIPGLLDLLRVPETNTRALARRRLQRSDPATVLSALDTWRESLDASDPAHDRLVLESLWVSHALGRTDLALLETVLTLPTPEVRAAGVRLVRRWLRVGRLERDEAAALLARTAEDTDMRVRLEAVVAAGYLETAEALDIVQTAMSSDTDGAMRVVIAETLLHLQGIPGVDSALARRARLYFLGREAFDAAEWDEDKAFVALRRPDASAEDRRRALDEIAGADAGRRLAVLTEAVLSSWDPDALAEPIAPLLIEAASVSSPPPPPDRRLASHPSPAVRALAAAWSLETGHPLAELLAADADAVIRALSLRADEILSTADETALRDAITSGGVQAGPAVAALAAGHQDPASLIDWLTDRVNEGAGLPLEPWSGQHDLALASLKALYSFPAHEWPEDMLPLRTERDPEALERGREVYSDELTGCIRCHGPDGQGLPGFPPLARSPWVHGDARRAATVVVHGLHGPLRVRDAGTFNSAMAPLGAILDDRRIADVLTFVRASWGNFAPPVTTEEVRQARVAVGPTDPMPDTAAVLARFPLDADTLLLGPALPAPASIPDDDRAAKPWGLAIPAIGLLVVLLLAGLGAAILGRRA